MLCLSSVKSLAKYLSVLNSSTTSHIAAPYRLTQPAIVKRRYITTPFFKLDLANNLVSFHVVGRMNFKSRRDLHDKIVLVLCTFNFLLIKTDNSLKRFHTNNITFRRLKYE